MVRRARTGDTALVKSGEMTGRVPKHCRDGSGKKRAKTTENKIGEKMHVCCTNGPAATHHGFIIPMAH
jgi:hypothetical protein